MSEVEVTEVHNRARRGIRLLMLRQVALQVLTMAGGVVLARTLTPAMFGLYAIANFMVTAFALFADFGLAPSLIQRKGEIGERDIQVAFLLQQVCTTSIVTALLIAAPWLVHFYPKAPPETVWLLRALAFSLFLTSWRTMSALQLERQLKYDRLAVIEVAETMLYQVTAVILAVTNHGVWSFVIATLARGVFGAVTIYAVAPWKVRFAFDATVAREILHFGVPYQFAWIVNNIGGWVTPVLVGSMIGPQAVGYLGWATSNGRKPLTLVDSVMRVAFPHFSRIQEDRSEVERLMVRYMTYLLLPAGAWFVVLAIAGPSLVTWIYTSKWNNAVPALCLYAMAMSLDVIVWVVGVSMNACGLSKLAAKRATVRTVGQVALAIPLVLKLGFNGVPIAYLIVMIVTLPWMFTGMGSGMMKRTLTPVSWLLMPMFAALAVGCASLQMHIKPLGLSIVSMSLHLHVKHLHMNLPVQGLLSMSVVILVYLGIAYFSAPGWLRDTVTGRVSKIMRLRPAAVSA